MIGHVAVFIHDQIQRIDLLRFGIEEPFKRAVGCAKEAMMLGCEVVDDLGLGGDVEE